MSPKKPDRILDYRKNITITFEDFPLKNLHALIYLPHGIHELAETVRQEELRAPGTLFVPGAVFMFAPGMLGQGLASYFCWFCSSLVNYLRLVGLIELVGLNDWSTNDIKTNAKTVKSHCRDYVHEAIPDITRWRNKVAAHFALTDPFAEDNLGLLEYSVMDFVGFNHPYFSAGGMAWSTEGEDSDMPTWALTEVFEKLAPRFWPERALTPFPANFNQ